MSRAKELIDEIRENLRLVTVKVETLKGEEGLDLSIEIGTNLKTVEFTKVKHFEAKVKATVVKDL